MSPKSSLGQFDSSCIIKPVSSSSSFALHFQKRAVNLNISLLFIFSTSETVALLQNKPIIYPDTIFKLTSRHQENERQSNFLRSFHQRIIDERREILKNNNNKSDDTDLGYSIFIDHILNNEGMFSDEDIQHHVITVLSAGEMKV